MICINTVISILIKLIKCYQSTISGLPLLIYNACVPTVNIAYQNSLLAEIRTSQQTLKCSTKYWMKCQTNGDEARIALIKLNSNITVQN